MENSSLNDTVRQTRQRAQRYWFIDGLNELGFALVCLLLSVYFLAEHQLSGRVPISSILDVSLVLALIAVAFVSRWLVSAIKSRLTFPRTGYVSYQRGSPARRMAVVAIFVFISNGLAVYLTMRSQTHWAAAVTSMLIAIALGVVAYRINLLRFYILAGLSLATGLVITYLGLEQELGLGIYYGVLGIMLTVSGGLTLARYLKETEPAEDSAA